MAVKFDKYDRYGAIHWRTSNPLALRYSPTLVSRYWSVLKRLPPGAGSILDIGCGDGRLTYLIAKARPRAEVLGLDTEMRGIEQARQKAEQRGCANVAFARVTDAALNRRDASVDIVVMTDVIEHLPHPDDSLREIRRVLRPQGTAIITTPNRQQGSKWDIRHVHEYDAAELATNLERFFHDVQVFGSWRMKTYRWGKTVLGRITLNLLSRIGVDLLAGAVEKPSAEWGQLTAICTRPREEADVYPEQSKLVKP